VCCVCCVCCACCVCVRARVRVHIKVCSIGMHHACERAQECACAYVHSAQFWSRNASVPPKWWITHAHTSKTSVCARTHTTRACVCVRAKTHIATVAQGSRTSSSASPSPLAHHHYTNVPLSSKQVCDVSSLINLRTDVCTSTTSPDPAPREAPPAPLPPPAPPPAAAP